MLLNFIRTRLTDPKASLHLVNISLARLNVTVAGVARDLLQARAAHAGRQADGAAALAQINASATAVAQLVSDSLSQMRGELVHGRAEVQQVWGRLTELMHDLEVVNSTGTALESDLRGLERALREMSTKGSLLAEDVETVTRKQHELSLAAARGVNASALHELNASIQLALLKEIRAVNESLAPACSTGAGLEQVQVLNESIKVLERQLESISREVALEKGSARERESEMEARWSSDRKSDLAAVAAVEERCRRLELPAARGVNASELHELNASIQLSLLREIRAANESVLRMVKDVGDELGRHVTAGEAVKRESALIKANMSVIQTSIASVNASLASLRYQVCVCLLLGARGRGCMRACVRACVLVGSIGADVGRQTLTMVRSEASTGGGVAHSSQQVRCICEFCPLDPTHYRW